MKAERSTLSRLLTLFVVVLMTFATTAHSVAAAERVAAIGSVTAVGAVDLRGVPVTLDATIFAGDALRAGKNSAASLALASGFKVEVSAESEIIVDGSAAGADVALSEGSVAFSGSERSPGDRSLLVVRVAPFEISMTGAGSGAVRVEGTDSVGVTAAEGALLVRNTESQESFVLTPGEERMLARWNPAPAGPLGEVASTAAGPIPAPRQDPPPVNGTGMSTAAWLAIVAGVAVGSTVGGWFWGDHGKVASPSEP